VTTVSAVAVDAVGTDLIERTWDALAGPGSFFTGAERLAIARSARAARGEGGTGAPTSAPVSDATVRIAAEAWTIRPHMIAEWAAAGLDVLAYVEVVSVVARVVALDTYVTALGLPLVPLPAPRPGDPEPLVDVAAVVSTGWVPTVGPAKATASLSALPREAAGAEAVTDALYLSYAGVADLRHDPRRPISRPQMELVASRTSWLNECFY
jgi:hypothetical protein